MKRSLIWLVLFATACSTGSKNEATAPETEASTAVEAAPTALDPNAFQKGIASGDVVVVDVRMPEEAAEGTLPGAQIIDFKAPDFAEQIQALDKDKEYYVYCKSGVRSGKAAEMMVNAGFKKVHTLEGGLLAWEASGLEAPKAE